VLLHQQEVERRILEVINSLPDRLPIYDWPTHANLRDFVYGEFALRGMVPMPLDYTREDEYGC
jgi:hypothetical protein